MPITYRMHIALSVSLLMLTAPLTVNSGEVELQVDNSFSFQEKVTLLFGIAVPTAKTRCLTGDNQWPCGATATLRLNQLLQQQPLSCQVVLESDDGVIARCFHGSQDLAALLLSEGWAITIADDSDYAEAESDARKRGHGIWRLGFQPPIEWRQYPKTAFDPYDDLACSVCAERRN